MNIIIYIMPMVGVVLVMEALAFCIVLLFAAEGQRWPGWVRPCDGSGGGGVTRWWWLWRCTQGWPRVINI